MSIQFDNTLLERYLGMRVFTFLERKRAVTKESFDPRVLSGRGFGPKAPAILKRAIDRGKIFPQEISAMVSTAVSKRREEIATIVRSLAEELRRLDVEIVTGSEVAKFIEEPIIHTPSTQNTPKRGGKHSTATPISDEQEVGNEYPASLNGASSIYTLLSDFEKQTRDTDRLSHEEEKDLGRKVQETGDISARNTLVERNMALVWWVARKYAQSGIPLEDLVQEGAVGLIVAADKFDFQRDVRFGTYAMWWIQVKITRTIQEKKSLISIPVHVQNDHKVIVKATRRLAVALGRQPTLEEVANEVSMSKVKVARVQKNMRQHAIVSLDAPAFPTALNGSSSINYADVIPDTTSANPLVRIEARGELQIAQQRMLEVIRVVAKINNNRYQSIFTTFYGLDNALEIRTLQSVGTIYELTHEGVRQIISTIWKALEKKSIYMGHEGFIAEISRIKALREFIEENE